jgi:hypothetical protein
LETVIGESEGIQKKDGRLLELVFVRIIIWLVECLCLEMGENVNAGTTSAPLKTSKESPLRVWSKGSLGVASTFEVMDAG